MTTDDPKPDLLLALSRSLREHGEIPLDLWRRLRAAWPAPKLARLLDAAAIDRALWPESLAATPLQRRTARPAIVLLVASIGVFMAFLDDTVVSIAFPNLIGSFPRAGLSELSWVLNAYNIVFAAALVPAGCAADTLGRRRIFTVGIGVFTLASGVCALAPSIEALIAARGLQGLGAAMIVPASLGLIIQAYPPVRRTSAIGLWAATGGAAAGVGPSIGGLLVDLSDWRLVFLVNLPVGLLALRLSGRQLVESRAPGQRQRPDLSGNVVLAATVALLTLAIVQGQDWGWTSPGVLAAVAAALAGAGVFARRWAVQPAPVVDREIVRVPGFRIASALSAIGSAGFFAIGLTNLLFLMQVWGYSPLRAGLAVTPAPFAGVIAAALSGWLVQHIHPRWLVAAGAALWTLGPLLLLWRMEPRPEYLGVYLPAALTMAAGVGVAFPIVSAAAVSDLAGGRFAGAIALNTAIRQVGAALGVAIVAALLSADAVAGVASEAAFDRTWIFAAGCFLAVTVGAFWLPARTMPAAGDSELDTLDRRLDRRSATQSARRCDAPAAITPVPQTRAELLAAVPIFAGAGDEVYAELARRCAVVRLGAGDVLFAQGAAAATLYVVQTGRLEVSRRRDDGSQELLRVLGPGEVAGELGLLSEGSRSATARCRRDAVLLRVGRQDFAAILNRQPQVGATVARVLARELQRARSFEAAPRPASATIAIVPLTAAAQAEQFDRALLCQLERLKRVAWIDGSAAVHSHRVHPGLALAEMLDRRERDHDIVLVSTRTTDDRHWLEACVRQADRVVLLVAEASERLPLPDELLSRCDIVLLQPAVDLAVQRLLDRLAPRATHRVTAEHRTADVARLARRLASRSVGLVLSGGGARGFAHIGAIEELQAAGITVDRVAGTSIGAFIGALLAHGMDAEEVDARCYEEWVRRNPLTDYRLPRHSLLRGHKVRAMLERNLPGLIEDLPRGFYCVSTDMIAAELVYHRRGELARAVGASMCVPAVGAPVPFGDRLLVDGGILDNLPISAMAADGEGPLIACDVTQPEQRSLAPGETLPVPKLMDTLMRLMLLGTTDTLEEARRHAALVIVPEHAAVGRTEFHLLDTMRESGRRAAARALEQAPPGLFT